MSNPFDEQEKVEMPIQIKPETSEKLVCATWGKTKVIVDNESGNKDYEHICICESNCRCSPISKFSTDEFHDVTIQSELSETKDEEGKIDIGQSLITKEESELVDLLSRQKLEVGEHSSRESVTNETDKLSVELSSKPNEVGDIDTEPSTKHNISCEQRVILPAWMNDKSESAIKLSVEQKEEGEQNFGLPSKKKTKLSEKLSNRLKTGLNLRLSKDSGDNKLFGELSSNRNIIDELSAKLRSVENIDFKPSNSLPFWLGGKTGTEQFIEKSEKGEQNIGLPPEIHKKNYFKIIRASRKQEKNKFGLNLQPEQACGNSSIEQIPKNKDEFSSNSSSGSSSSSSSTTGTLISLKSTKSKTCKKFPACEFDLVEPRIQIRQSSSSAINHRINDTSSTNDTNVVGDMHSVDKAIQTDELADNPFLHFSRDLYEALTQFLSNFSDYLNVEVEKCYKNVCFFVACMAMILLTLVFLIKRAIETK